MYRIRFHGRGGQGMKTASRILGTAFFFNGFEVQDAPRYGAERRGAPIFAFVRADHQAIYERGIIRRPDLIVVADDTLVPVPAAGVLQGIRAHTILLINSRESASTWKERLNLDNPVFILPVAEQVQNRADLPYIGATCAGAAARLLGVITQQSLQQAITEELSHLGNQILEKNIQRALQAYEAMSEHEGTAVEASEITAHDYELPDWINLPFEDARTSAPVIHAAATSTEVKTGLWRTMRPVIDYDRCNRCWWVCSSFCPDGAISINEKGFPQIDYEHCKGCMICVAQCPPHAIAAIAESQAQKQETHEQATGGGT
jgi:pyruvate ferredoxin oxidoreductase gamma subunit